MPNTAAARAQRVAELIAAMSLPEKVAQLYGVWVGVDDSTGAVAPFQHELAEAPADWAQLIEAGLGQLTRPFGTRPVQPRAGAHALAQVQRQIMAAGRFGASMRELGVHQGLAPLLDVVRDLRWARSRRRSARTRTWSPASAAPTSAGWNRPT